jgi:hypothetical protein
MRLIAVAKAGISVSPVVDHLRAERKPEMSVCVWGDEIETLRKMEEGDGERERGEREREWLTTKTTLGFLAPFALILEALAYAG